MPGGGLMQLVAYGAQDVYLTGNNNITFYGVQYRRHTNFAMESINIEDNNIDPIIIPVREIIIMYNLLDQISGINICVISLEPIEENGEYWNCTTCNKVVTWEAAEIWISQHKTCPHCRQSVGLDTKYVNGAEHPTEF